MIPRYPELGFLLAAGGGSTRYGSGNKLFETLGPWPVFIHAVKNFAPLCAEFVIAVPDCQREEFATLLNDHAPGTQVLFSSAGPERAITVRNALNVFKQCQYIAIHDAARPLADQNILDCCYAAACEHGAAIPAKRISNTVKRTDARQFVIETIERENLWSIETPQLFDLEKLRRAFELAGDRAGEFTDDGAIMENAGFPVKIIENPAPNFKLTYPDDLAEFRHHITMRLE